MSRAFTETDIHLALDGELPADERAAFELWVEANADMKALFERYMQDRDRLRSALEGVTHEPIPERLRSVVVGDARKTARAGTFSRYAAAAALLVFGGLGGYFAGQRTQTVQQPAMLKPIAENAMAAHLIYANEKRHVVEVGADQTDHLNAWLSNRVGVKIVAPDLKSGGFDLVGGRLLPFDGKTAAQFMYQDPTGNRLSLYVTKDETRQDSGYKYLSVKGTDTLFWLDGGYGCALTGNLPEKALTQLADITYDQLVKSAGVSD
ncbi:MAG: anti-sigma factor [Rhizobiaceae bacterium]|nr:anti-sigma factor [Rhizobiaceae bacterium]